MRRVIPIVLAAALLVGCAAHRKVTPTTTLADLHKIRPDVQEVKVDQGLDQAMQSYRRFLEETPETSMTPEAMRRLADLQIEKQYGIHTGDVKAREMAAPKPAPAPASTPPHTPESAVADSGRGESDRDFERRTTAESPMLATSAAGTSLAGVEGADAAPKGPVEAIAIYKRLLTEYPSYKDSDQVLYQMARAYDELGRTDEAMETMERLIRTNPHSEHYEEALHRYMALLDYKVSTGYDFDQKHGKEDERRVADTFRAVRLSFSNLGGSEAVQ